MERVGKRDRAAALVFGQVGIARRQREAVLVADDRNGDDLCSEVEVDRQPPDHRELLEILFPKNRDLGPDRVEKLGDDGRDAVEMTGPGLAFPALAEACDRDARGKTGGVHLLGRRHPQKVAAGGVERPCILFLLPRIALEVLALSELQRVDEQAGDNPVRLPARLFDQREMAAMERAHRRHQRHPVPAGAQCDERAAQLFIVTDRLHRGLASGKLLFGAALVSAVGIEFKGAAMVQPHFIVFANEKGGTGKSTTAVHTAIALAATGQRVAALDLDSRQRTMTRYLENRDSTIRRLEKDLPKAAYEVLEDGAPLDTAIARLSEGADVVVIDTPGRDDAHAREAILKADTLVTPMNDSFVDLDLIGQVHPENFKVTKPSFYAELIWNSRTQRAKATGKSVDWVVLRNRLQHVDSHNLRRVGAALDELARRVGFRVIPGLGERVIYRELFPKGLTLLDFEHLGEVGIGHVAARQELREMISGLGIPGAEPEQKLAAAG